MTEQAFLLVVRPRIRIPRRLREKPLAILGVAKEAALEANWSLRRWEEFRKTCEACLSPEAEPEEMALFMRVVEERFDVS